MANDAQSREQQIIDELKKRGVEVPEAMTSTEKALGYAKQAAMAPVQFIRGMGDVPTEDILKLIPGEAGKKLLGRQLAEEAARGAPTMPYKGGRITGDIGEYLTGAEALGGLRAGAEALPYIGKLAQFAGRGVPAALSRIGGAAGYAKLKGDSPLTGAAIATGAEALPLPFRMLGYLAKKVRPQEAVNIFMNWLKGGESLEDNAKNFAKNIKNSYDINTEHVNDLYDPIFDRTGSNNIYYSRVKSPALYKNMFDPVTRNPADAGLYNDYFQNLKKLHNNFMEKPTFENAHDLQSELYQEVNNFQKMRSRGQLSSGDRRIMERFQNARENLKLDMDHFLDFKDNTGDLRNQYNDAAQEFINEKLPYRANPNIAQIATGKITNPKNITTLFKFPEEDVHGKIVSDIGPDANRRILYNELGKVTNYTPEKFVNEIDKLDKKGLGSYITPDIQRAVDTIKNKIKSKGIAQRIAGGAAAASLLPTRAGLAPEAATFLAGTAIAPSLIKGAQKVLPSTQSLTKAAQTTYPWLSKAAIAALLGGQ